MIVTVSKHEIWVMKILIETVGKPDACHILAAFINAAGTALLRAGIPSGVHVNHHAFWENLVHLGVAMGDALLVGVAQELLQGRGFPVFPLDVSELHKAEAGLTCMSLIFNVA